MLLTPNFTLAELVASQTAARLGIDNTPSPEIIENLRSTAALLEECRTVLGNKPLIVSSGYRCPELNKAVGGVPGGAHVAGKAADFVRPGLSVATVCQRLAGTPGLRFDQIIREFDQRGAGWVHIAWSATPRMQVLTIDHNGTREGLA